MTIAIPWTAVWVSESSDIADAQFLGELSGHAMKAKRRPAGGQVEHFEVLPPHTAPPARPDGFHPGFLGGESRGVALVAVGFALDVGDFGRRVDALDETPSMTFDGVADAVHLRQVDARFRRSQLGAGGRDGEAPVLDALGADQGIRDLFHRARPCP